jgi:hypothetical protein
MVAAGASSSAALAGDLVFRTLTYLLPIPVGGMTYVIWRRKKSWRKPGGTEPESSVARVYTMLGEVLRLATQAPRLDWTSSEAQGG